MFKNCVYVLLALCCFVASSAYSNNTCLLQNTGDMPSSVKQELKILCEQALLQHQAGSAPLASDPEKLSQYGLAAQEWAKAIGLAADELGMATNEFLTTPAGKMTAGIIIWKVAGDSIKGVLLGIPLLFFTVIFGVRLAKSFQIEQITYVNGKYWFNKRKIESITASVGAAQEKAMVIYCITLMVSVWLVVFVIL